MAYFKIHQFKNNPFRHFEADLKGKAVKVNKPLEFSVPERNQLRDNSHSSGLVMTGRGAVAAQLSLLSAGCH